MLVVNDVTKRYGKVVACDRVSFAMEPGKITVLLGPNGSGKSTIIKSITGFLRYTGAITVEGHLNKTTEAKRLLGYIPEMPALYPNLTVWEHIEFLARVYKLQDWEPYAEALVDRFELTDKKKKFGDELSKGMQQKLSIVLGLLPRPKYILFDEPMVGLDPHAIKELKTIMHTLRDSGAAILVSTHMIDSVDMLWDTVVIMQQGQVRANVPRAAVDAGEQSLEDLFFAITEGGDREAN